MRDLPEYLWDSDERRAAASAGTGVEPATTTPDAAGISLEEHERPAYLIVQALEAAGGNQTHAARRLRIGRDALRYKVKKYNL